MGDAIKSIKARQVLDSRGNPTVEAEVETAKGVFQAIVPSGASTGKHEALELRDGEKEYLGKGVLKAVKNVNERIGPKLVGMDCTQQNAIDNAMIELDGTKNKERLGANAILAVSMGCAKAGAASQEQRLFEYLGELSGRKGKLLPIPQLNVMNGESTLDWRKTFKNRCFSR